MFVFLPIFPPMITLWGDFLRFSTIFAKPSLLKPILLIIPPSSINLKRRFFGLPDCAFGVTVPISTNPNPKSANSLNSTAFLSKPAAKPTGFLNFKPNNSRSRRLSSMGFGKNNLVKKPKFLRIKKVKWWTFSGSNLKKIGRRSDLYILKKGFTNVQNFLNTETQSFTRSS